MKGIPNYGATCWFNALMQCLKQSREWENHDLVEDPFTREFLKFMIPGNYEPRPFLQEFVKKFPSWGGMPNDAQEAFLLILDILEKTINLKDFTGEITQTITYPTGTSVTKYPFTIYNFDKDLVLSNYKDSSGIIHNVAIQQNFITKKPKILVASVDNIEKVDFGEPFALIPWCMGHYVAFVKDSEGSWHLIDDDSVSAASPNMTRNYYLALYKYE
jgi:hypothetical protein